MRVRVMSDLVSAPNYLPHQMRQTGGAFSHDEERRARVTPVQQVENAGRILRVGTVVNREPDSRARRGETGEHANESLRGRRKQRVQYEWIGRDEKHHGCPVIARRPRRNGDEFCPESPDQKWPEHRKSK
jgi:hypothetical protein